ncbi:MAG: endolytic transglycosylase MltG [Motiliproteus sp.]
MRAVKHLLIGAALIAIVVAIAAYIGQTKVSGIGPTPLLLQQAEPLQVPAGSSFRAVVEQLSERGIVDQPLLLRLYARQHKLAHRIQAGEYWLEPGTTHQQLMELMVKGKVRNYQVTLVEGQTVRQYMAVLHAHPQIIKTLEQTDPLNIAKQLGIEGSAEGWIYPDTYLFPQGMTDLKLLRRAYQAMQKVVEQEWPKRSQSLPLETPYQALIMASIVEKETGASSERAMIAGVFTRRLQKPMRLQTDPTVIYGMGESYRGNITRADLQRKTPYNTYRINGLPPTPIANPGRAAIQAALNPAAGNALYFVAKGDGSHQFSATLAQHNRAVTQYQRSKRRKDYRSAPAQKEPEVAVPTDSKSAQ